MIYLRIRTEIISTVSIGCYQRVAVFTSRMYLIFIAILNFSYHHSNSCCFCLELHTWHCGLVWRDNFKTLKYLCLSTKAFIVGGTVA